MFTFYMFSKTPMITHASASFLVWLTIAWMYAASPRSLHLLSHCLPCTLAACTLAESRQSSRQESRREIDKERIVEIWNGGGGGEVVSVGYRYVEGDNARVNESVLQGAAH